MSNKSHQPVGLNYYLTLAASFLFVALSYFSGYQIKMGIFQRALRHILPADAILIGHSLEFDLRALSLCHPYCIDVALSYNLSGNERRRSSLKVSFPQGSLRFLILFNCFRFGLFFYYFLFVISVCFRSFFYFLRCLFFFLFFFAFWFFFCCVLFLYFLFLCLRI